MHPSFIAAKQILEERVGALTQRSDDEFKSTKIKYHEELTYFYWLYRGENYVVVSVVFEHLRSVRLSVAYCDPRTDDGDFSDCNYRAEWACQIDKLDEAVNVYIEHLKRRKAI